MLGRFALRERQALANTRIGMCRKFTQRRPHLLRNGIPHVRDLPDDCGHASDDHHLLKERVEGRFEGLGVVREANSPLFSKVEKLNG